MRFKGSATTKMWRILIFVDALNKKNNLNILMYDYVVYIWTKKNKIHICFFSFFCFLFLRTSIFTHLKSWLGSPKKPKFLEVSSVEQKIKKGRDPTSQIFPWINIEQHQKNRWKDDACDLELPWVRGWNRWNPTPLYGKDSSGQMKSRPKTRVLGPPKGNFLEGKWDPGYFREIYTLED